MTQQIWVADLGVGPGQIEVVEQPGDLKDAIQEGRPVAEVECDAGLRGTTVHDQQPG